MHSIGEARFVGNSENKRHLAGDNLAALVAWPFILLSNIQSEKLERNQSKQFPAKVRDYPQKLEQEKT